MIGARPKEATSVTQRESPGLNGLRELASPASRRSFQRYNRAMSPEAGAA